MAVTNIYFRTKTDFFLISQFAPKDKKSTADAVP